MPVLDGGVKKFTPPPFRFHGAIISQPLFFIYNFGKIFAMDIDKNVEVYKWLSFTGKEKKWIGFF